MSDELKEIEIETARIKLERERMALESELQKKQRIEDVKAAAANMVSAMAGNASKRFFLTIGKVVLWAAVIFIAATAIKFSLRF